MIRALRQMITPQIINNNKVADMVAKNLLAFVGVGILSGLALGLYLSETRDGYFIPKTMTAADGPSISVIPMQTIFEEGEQVVFRIINSGNVPLYSDSDGSSIYGAAITGLAGILIYAFDSQDVIFLQQTNQTGQAVSHTHAQLPFEEPSIETLNDFIEADVSSTLEIDTAPAIHDITRMLLPGQEMHMSWDQTRQDGESVQAGVYKINIQAHTATQVVDMPPENASNPTMVKDSFTITIQ